MAHFIENCLKKQMGLLDRYSSVVASWTLCRHNPFPFFKTRIITARKCVHCSLVTSDILGAWAEVDMFTSYVSI